MQSAAVVCAVEDFSKSLEDVEQRGVLALVLGMMRRGVQLDEVETELLRGILFTQAQDWPGRHLQDAYHKLYGHWPVQPAWWEERLKAKGWKP